VKSLSFSIAKAKFFQLFLELADRDLILGRPLRKDGPRTATLTFLTHDPVAAQAVFRAVATEGKCKTSSTPS
jgi:hypothetical protein